MPNLDQEELRLLCDDLEDSLEGTHNGPDCEDLSLCPADHFDEEEDVITLSQSMLKKIKEAL